MLSSQGLVCVTGDSSIIFPPRPLFALSCLGLRGDVFSLASLLSFVLPCLALICLAVFSLWLPFFACVVSVCPPPPLPCVCPHSALSVVARASMHSWPSESSCRDCAWVLFLSVALAVGLSDPLPVCLLVTVLSWAGDITYLFFFLFLGCDRRSCPCRHQLILLDQSTHSQTPSTAVVKPGQRETWSGEGVREGRGEGWGSEQHPSVCAFPALRSIRCPFFCSCLPVPGHGKGREEEGREQKQQQQEQQQIPTLAQTGGQAGGGGDQDEEPRGGGTIQKGAAGGEAG